MKVCIICNRRKQLFKKPPECDIALFPFGAVKEVSYADELSGKTDVLERLARFSGESGCGVLCGLVTDSRGIRRKSVAVAAGGRLIAISDMLNVLDGEDFKCGAGVGVYAVGGYKVGLCIDSDLYFPENIQTLAACGCNIICVHTQSADVMAPVLIRAYAYLYGIPVALCSGGAAYFADITGVMACSNQEAAVFECSPKNCYRTVTRKIKGIISGQPCDY